MDTPGPDLQLTRAIGVGSRLYALRRRLGRQIHLLGVNLDDGEVLQVARGARQASPGATIAPASRTAMRSATASISADW